MKMKWSRRNSSNIFAQLHIYYLVLSVLLSISRNQLCNLRHFYKPNSFLPLNLQFCFGPSTLQIRLWNLSSLYIASNRTLFPSHVSALNQPLLSFISLISLMIPAPPFVSVMDLNLEFRFCPYN